MYLDRALSNMCDDILINVFVCLYTCQIYLYFCINLYKSCICTAKRKNTGISVSYFCGARFLFLWRTNKQCATEFLCCVYGDMILWCTAWVRHRKLVFLWRTPWVRHRNNFSGENSVAHPANLGVRHRIPKPCATNSRFCTSEGQAYVAPSAWPQDPEAPTMPPPVAPPAWLYAPPPYIILSDDEDE